MPHPPSRYCKKCNKEGSLFRAYINGRGCGHGKYCLSCYTEYMMHRGQAFTGKSRRDIITGQGKKLRRQREAMR